MTELYAVPAAGGRVRQVLGTPAEMVNFDKSGKRFLYQDRKGTEDEWRKHHTSSVTRDIWMYDTATGKHTNLTDRPGEDRNAVFAPDGETVYFLSERDTKSINVYSFPLNSPQSVKAVTSFKTHPVRFLSQKPDSLLHIRWRNLYAAAERQTCEGEHQLDSRRQRPNQRFALHVGSDFRYHIV